MCVVAVAKIILHYEDELDLNEYGVIKDLENAIDIGMCGRSLASRFGLDIQVTDMEDDAE